MRTFFVLFVLFLLKYTIKKLANIGYNKIYELDGPLFFASVTSFQEQFDIENDPSEVVIDFQRARVMDSSGVEAIDAITEKYKQVNKSLSIRYLSTDCRNMLKSAGPFCAYQENDPTYKVSANI